MNALDYGVVALYLVVIFAVGLAVSRGQNDRVAYFLANRRMPQWVVGFTLMATLISSNTLVAHPAVVYQRGMILVPGFLVMPFVLVFVALYVVPFYRRVVGMSAYEYIGERFGLAGRLYTAFGFIMSRTLGIGVTLVTTAIAVNVLTGVSIRSAIIGIGAFTVFYTMIGGIAAVVWTDVVQGFLLMIGGLLILGRLLWAPEVGTDFAVLQSAWDAGRFSLGSFETGVDTLYDTSNRTAYMFMIAMTIQWSRRYICDQAMVQRYLIAKSERAAVRGTLVGALLSVPVLLTFNLIGAALYGFYELSGATPPAISDHVMPHFVLNFMPHGFIGIMLAAILAASMSSISSDLNSVSTVVTRDFFERFLARFSDRRLLFLGRVMVLVAGGIAALVGVSLIPTEQTTPLAERALIITVIVSAGTLGLFSLGFLTKRATRQGCYVGIVACIVFTLWAVATEPTGRMIDMGDFNFEMNAILIGVFGHLIVFGVGYLASLILGGYRPAADELERLQLFAGRRRPAVDA